MNACHGLLIHDFMFNLQNVSTYDKSTNLYPLAAGGIVQYRSCSMYQIILDSLLTFAVNISIQFKIQSF